jgi:hypothetical protein
VEAMIPEQTMFVLELLYMITGELRKDMGFRIIKNRGALNLIAFTVANEEEKIRGLVVVEKKTKQE